MIDISKLSKAKVLCALYNNSRPMGMGYLQAKDGVMSESDATELLEHSQRFDYLFGRVMKVDLQHVHAKRSEFLALCEGDIDIANRFLAKHFDQELINKAETWGSENAS